MASVSMYVGKGIYSPDPLLTLLGIHKAGMRGGVLNP